MIALPGLTLVTGRYADAKKIIKRFVQVFWNPAGGYLFDVVDGEQRDGAIRPNQILSLSLPFALLGSYLTALVRVRGKTGRKQGLKLV